jgi:hypothetical protein
MGQVKKIPFFTTVRNNLPIPKNADEQLEIGELRGR